MNLINLSRRGGDASIGQTLVRLAGLAASAHRYEVAARMSRPAVAPTDGWRGGDPLPESFQRGTDAAHVHTEVDL